MTRAKTLVTICQIEWSRSLEYAHVGSDDAVIQVVGVAKAEMASGNVLWLL